MGTKIYRLFEYLYIVMAVFSLYVAYTAWVVDDRNRAYLFIFFSVVAVFMFYFKRNFRKKMEADKKEE